MTSRKRGGATAREARTPTRASAPSATSTTARGAASVPFRERTRSSPGRATPEVITPRRWSRFERMDAACLDYCLTDAERDEFEERGFLVVPDALDASTVAHMSRVADEVFADAVAAGHDPKTVLVDKHI